TLIAMRQQRAELATLEETILHAHTHLAPVFMATHTSVSPVLEEREEDIVEEEELAAEEHSTIVPSIPSAAPTSLADGRAAAGITVSLEESIRNYLADLDVTSCYRKRTDTWTGPLLPTL